MTGSALEDILTLATDARLEFDFRANYLPDRLKTAGVDQPSSLPYYPYRDDALLLWDAIREWVDQFLSCYYKGDEDVRSDTELQNWAREIAGEDGGSIKNFISESQEISSRVELIDMVTMILFTAGPQHAAVNFPQKSDMAYLPAAPLAGYIPEIKGYGHTEADYLAFLPPMEVACTTQMALDFLGDVYFNKLGSYALTFALDDESVRLAIEGFQRKLQEIELVIVQRDTERVFSYPHLRPSRIPKSINV
jgi:arachidonate 15-lipoxygenase